MERKGECGNRRKCVGTDNVKRKERLWRGKKVWERKSVGRKEGLWKGKDCDGGKFRVWEERK